MSNFDVAGQTHSHFEHLVGWQTIQQLDRLPPDNAVRYGYGVFTPSAGLPNQLPRYGFPAEHSIGLVFGDHEGSTEDMQNAADQGRLVKYGVPVGTHMVDADYYDARQMRAKNDSGSYIDQNILEEVMQASRNEWNSEHPEAQPGGHAQPVTKPAAPPAEAPLTAGQPHLQLLVEAQNALHELDKAFPGGHGGGPWAVKLRELANAVIAELGAKG